MYISIISSKVFIWALCFQSKSLIGDTSIVFSPPSIIKDTLPDEEFDNTSLNTHSQVLYDYAYAGCQVLAFRKLHNMLFKVLGVLIWAENHYF